MLSPVPPATPRGSITLVDVVKVQEDGSQISESSVAGTSPVPTRPTATPSPNPAPKPQVRSFTHACKNSAIANKI